MKHPFSTEYAGVVLALRAMWLGRADEAADHARRAIDAADRHGLLELNVYAALPLGWSDLVLGPAGHGAQRLTGFVGASRLVDGGLSLCSWIVLPILALAHASQGEGDAAHAWLLEADEFLARSEFGQHGPLLDVLGTPRRGHPGAPFAPSRSVVP